MPRSLLFFDCETGGTDPAVHDMLEVACILTDPTGGTLLKQYSSKILPTRPVDPEAARVNGYDPMRWSVEGVELRVAMEHVLAMGRSATFVAHNATFDWSFVQAAVTKLKCSWPASYRLDTITLAYPLLRTGKVPDLKLATLARHFNLKHDNAHSALGDVKVCREVFLRLTSMYERCCARQVS